MMVTEPWCWVPLVQCSNPMFSSHVLPQPPQGHRACWALPAASCPSEEMRCCARLSGKERVYREIWARHRRSLDVLQGGRVGRFGCWKVLGVAEYVGRQQGGICIFECLVCIGPPFFPFPENSRCRQKLQIWEVAVL